MTAEKWDEYLRVYLPRVDEINYDDVPLFPGRWVPSTNEDYWGVVHGEGARVYATQSNPRYGPLMTSWCDENGCPTVAAIGGMQDPHGPQPTQFYRWEATS